MPGLDPRRRHATLPLSSGEQGMVAFVGILGALQMLCGILFYAGSKSAMHEILAATTFGMGVIAFALGCILEQLKAMEGSRP